MKSAHLCHLHNDTFVIIFTEHFGCVRITQLIKLNCKRLNQTSKCKNWHNKKFLRGNLGASAAQLFDRGGGAIARIESVPMASGTCGSPDKTQRVVRELWMDFEEVEESIRRMRVNVRGALFSLRRRRRHLLSAFRPATHSVTVGEAATKRAWLYYGSSYRR